MKIIIAGAGAVGFNLARELSADGHDITVIEPDRHLIQELRERLDLHALNGSCTDADVLKEAHVDQADIFIAVTNSDEVNIVASFMAHALEAKRRIARVRNPSLSAAEALVPKRDFHINRVVNPDVLAAETAVQLVESPGVRYQAEFAEGEVLLRAFRLGPGSGIDRVPLAELAKRYPGRPFLVAAILRDGKVRIPRGHDMLKEDDTVYLLMLKGAEAEFAKILGQDEERRVGRVVVYGASSIGLSILKRIVRASGRILVDERRDAAKAAARALDGVLVLNGWVSDEDVASEVDYKEVDCFLAAGDDDRMNLVAALYAKQKGARRTLVLAREPDIVPLLQALEFDAVINARLLAVSEILRFIRPGKVLAVRKIAEGGAEAVEFLVRKGSKAAEKSLKDLRLPDGAIVGAVFRDGAAFLPTGETTLQVGDDIVAFVLDEVREAVERVFAGDRKILFESKPASSDEE